MTAGEAGLKGPEIHNQVYADRVFAGRMQTYLERRYGSEMEVAPMVLWAIIAERASLSLGAETAASSELVDELLASVRYVGDESPSETAALAQAWAVLCRILAGEPHSSRGVREALTSAIELIEVARARCERLQERTTYRGANQVNLGPGMSICNPSAGTSR